MSVSVIPSTPKTSVDKVVAAICKNTKYVPLQEKMHTLFSQVKEYVEGSEKNPYVIRNAIEISLKSLYESKATYSQIDTILDEVCKYASVREKKLGIETRSPLFQALDMIHAKSPYTKEQEPKIEKLRDSIHNVLISTNEHIKSRADGISKVQKGKLLEVYEGQLNCMKDLQSIDHRLYNLLEKADLLLQYGGSSKAISKLSLEAEFLEEEYQTRLAGLRALLKKGELILDIDWQHETPGAWDETEVGIQRTIPKLNVLKQLLGKDLIRQRSLGLDLIPFIDEALKVLDLCIAERESQFPRPNTAQKYMQDYDKYFAGNLRVIQSLLKKYKGSIDIKIINRIWFVLDYINQRKKDPNFVIKNIDSNVLSEVVKKMHVIRVDLGLVKRENDSEVEETEEVQEKRSLCCRQQTQVEEPETEITAETENGPQGGLEAIPEIDEKAEAQDASETEEAAEEVQEKRSFCCRKQTQVEEPETEITAETENGPQGGLEAIPEVDEAAEEAEEAEVQEEVPEAESEPDVEETQPRSRFSFCCRKQSQGTVELEEIVVQSSAEIGVETDSSREDPTLPEHPSGNFTELEHKEPLSQAADASETEEVEETVSEIDDVEEEQASVRQELTTLAKWSAIPLTVAGVVMGIFQYWSNGNSSQTRI